MLWFIVTVVLPLSLPVLAMLCLQLFPTFASTARWIVPIKDGQLCWGAIGMAFSGMYEILFPAQSANVDGGMRGAAVIGFALLLFFSALIAAVGAIAPTVMPKPAGAEWYRHYSILAASLAITLVAIVSYTVVHFVTNP